uniref:Protein E6 n=1 Tax=Human papillomavirus 39 TaxID=10588 RepID=T2A5Y4_HPV39|nr:E6 [human papillomavirus 39]QDO72236.1 E6 protein [human papillomavirus 39]
MARFHNPAERPYKLPDLCTTLDTTLHDITIACVYCRRPLQQTEVYEFAFSDLYVVYRDGEPLAACQSCIKFYAKIRELRYYSDSVYGTTLENITNTKLYNLLIRCMCCLKPLCPAEKLRHLNSKRRFHKIAGSYTGQCRRCWTTKREDRRLTRRETQV